MFKKASNFTHPTPTRIFHPPDPPIASQSFTRDASVRKGGRSNRRENDAWGKVRLGALGRGDENRGLFQHR
jgi:hypothetical protein